MKKRQILVVTLLVLCCLSLFLQNSYGQDLIAQSGNTVISAASKNIKVKVTFLTNKVKPPLPISEVTKAKAVSRVEKLSISINGKDLFVPYSVFADLIDPYDAVIKFENKDIVLYINGGDASEAYTLRVYFNSKQVYRRTYFDAYFPKEPMQDTRYWLRVLKDE